MEYARCNFNLRRRNEEEYECNESKLEIQPSLMKDIKSKKEEWYSLRFVKRGLYWIQLQNEERIFVGRGVKHHQDHHHHSEDLLLLR